MSSQTQTAKPRRSAGKKGLPWPVTALLLLPVAVVLLPTSVVLLIGMVPTAVAYMVDRSRAHHQAITVGVLNFCGTLPGIADLWERGQTYGAALRISTDALYWLTAYGAAAVGWGIYLVMPPILAAYFAMTTSRRVVVLRRRQEKLVEEWGEDIRDTTPGAEPSE
ncbi:MAG: hypothetical protein ACE5DS_02070 [Kiloniellaceae bacterium]